MRDLIMKAKPDRLEDLIALNALYRPGPMDLDPGVHRAQARRQRWEYLDPRLKDILEPTYGVMTYQEHVMTIAQVIGGYTLGGADLLRRAMGKKKPEEMAKQRAIFLAGAASAGSPRDRRESSSTRWRSSPGTASTSRTRRPTRSSPTRRRSSRRTTRRLHGREPFGAHGRHRQGADPLRRRREERPQIDPPDINTSGARFQPVDAKRIATAWAREGTGEGASTTSSPRARPGDPSRTSRTSAGASTGAS
jgi:DNA polymerase-3 subunit alpha